MQRSKEVKAAIYHFERLRQEVEEANPGIKPHTTLGSRTIRELCWDTFTASERAWIAGELIHCRQDFRYFAGNYIWLFQPRSGRPQLLDLNDSQEWILEIIEKQWSIGKPGRILLHKARQIGGCLAPDTRVLTSDLRWVPILDVKAGQVLVSVDEEFQSRNGLDRGLARRMRPAVVEATNVVYDHAVRLVMDNGQSLVATADHRFLSRYRTAPNTLWKKVKDFVVGDSIRYITSVWSEPNYEDGWFGGLLDGEGSLRAKLGAGSELTVSQRFGPVYERARDYLVSNGYSARKEIDDRPAGESSKFGAQPVGKLTIGRMNEIFKLVGKTRPSRLVNRQWWDGKELPGKGGKNGPGGGPAWGRIVEIEPLGKQVMVDLQTSTKTYIAEGFVSHNSELSMSLACHQSVLFSNRVVMMIAQDSTHAPYTFSAFQYKMFNLPYWMQPNVDALEKKELMVLATRDENGYGGLNNYILSFQIEKMSAFAQGKAVTMLWATEVSNWPEDKARRVLKGDLTEALVKRPGTVAILESKPEGAAGFWYNFWHHHSDKGLRSAWYSAFIPVFFERSRIAKVPQTFKPRPDEVSIRERYALEWRRCQHCSTSERPIYYYAGGNSNAECLKCGATDGDMVMLSDEQLGWYRTRKAEADDPKNPDRRRDMKLFKQECAVTAEEGFQILEDQVFPDDVIHAVEMSVMDASWVGELRQDYSWHNKIPLRCPRPECYGEKHCLTCHQNHEEEEMYLSVWEFPKPGQVYFVGVDASYGFEEGDYGVISVLRQGSGMVNPDVQVAEYRGRVDAGELGKICYLMAMVYNYAQVSIEVQNGPGEKTQYQLVLMNYTHLWRWKHYDAIRPYTNRLGWVTNARTKPMLVQTMIQWTRQGLVKFRSKQFLHEMKSFVRRVDYDESGAGSAARGRTDDTIMAGLIGLFCFHDEHFDEERGRIIIPSQLIGENNPDAPPSESRYWVTCLNGHQSATDTIRGWVCQECKRLARERGMAPQDADKFNVFARSAVPVKQGDPQRRIDFDADLRQWAPVLVPDTSEQVEIL